jgi:hypothetical protein
VEGVWRELLEVPRVGVEGNIFDVGGNSLLAVQASRRISELVGRSVPLVAMFQYPTVRRLAAHLGAADAPGDVGGAGRERAAGRLDAMERRRLARARRVPE